MAQGLQNPFLRGMLASQAAADRSTANQIGAIQGLLGAQSMMRRDALAEQMAPLQLKLMQAQVGAAENPAPIMKDLGGSIGVFDPRTFQQIGVLPKTATPDAMVREQGAMQRHATPSGGAILSEQGAMQRHALPSGAAQLSAEVSMRGQNMVDARARQGLEQGRMQYDAARGGLVNLRTGEFMPATMGGAPIPPVEKAPTEGQGRAAMFGTRAAQSDSTLSQLEDEISTTGLAVKQAVQNTPLIGGVVGAAGNVMLSPEQQRVEQAQRDFVNATLRQESGAVISPQEFDNAKKQYFPQPGDTQAVIEQKRRNRQLVIQGFKRMSGPVAGDVEMAASPVGAQPERRKADRRGAKPADAVFSEADAILGRR